LNAGILALLVCALAGVLSGQARGVASGGAGMTTARVTSPAVVASWMSHESAADGTTTTLLVLWRGTPGWFSRGGRGGGSGAGSSGGFVGRGSYAYQSFSEGGLTFTLEFDHERHTAKLLNQEFSLKDTNVVLVDFVDSPGPAVVGARWVEPGPPAPPAVPGAAPDPVAGVIRRSPELFDYLRCDLGMPDTAMSAMITMVCGLMRPASPQ
jgi:hypothetical protein